MSSIAVYPRELVVSPSEIKCNDWEYSACWPFKAVSQTMVASLEAPKPNSSGWKDYQLMIVIPKDFDRRTIQIAFPEESGINKFGNYLVFQEDGYFVSNVEFVEGLRLHFDSLGTKTEAFCDDEGRRFRNKN